MKGLPGTPGSVPQSVKEKFNAAKTSTDRAVVVNAFVKKDAKHSDSVPLLSSLLVRRWRMRRSKRRNND